MNIRYPFDDIEPNLGAIAADANVTPANTFFRVHTPFAFIYLKRES
jgi:hypothetical protein